MDVEEQCYDCGNEADGVDSCDECGQLLCEDCSRSYEETICDRCMDMKDAKEADEEELGRVAWETFHRNDDYKVPSWEALPENTRQRWADVANVFKDRFKEEEE